MLGYGWQLAAGTWDDRMPIIGIPRLGLCRSRPAAR
jgi:TRAP-type C4-dicarboxylate transport system permease small subunit